MQDDEAERNLQSAGRTLGMICTLRGSPYRFNDVVEAERTDDVELVKACAVVASARTATDVNLTMI
jgi:hypothetical protein